MGKNSDQANPLFADDAKEAQRIKDTNAAETGSEVDAVDRSKSAESRCNACGSCDGNGRHAPASSVLTGSSGGKAWLAALALPASAHGAEPAVIHQHGFARANRTLETINESLDKQLEEVMAERDNFHDWDDRLAAAIAEYLGADIGEHSSGNNPWAEALDAVPDAGAQAGAVPEGFKLVPVIPTEEMFVDGMEADCTGLPSVDDEGHVHSIWNAMLAAAPSQPAPAQPDFKVTVGHDTAALLLNLLAAIHGDDGKHTNTVGLLRSVKEAQRKAAPAQPDAADAAHGPMTEAPEVGVVCWMPTAPGCALGSTWNGHPVDYRRLREGRYFRTEADARAALAAQAVAKGGDRG